MTIEGVFYPINNLDLTFYVSESSMPVLSMLLMDTVISVPRLLGSTIAQLCVEIVVHMQKIVRH